jgi:hypothetical protein
VTKRILPDQVTITPKDGYLVAKFPILPTTISELKDQMPREVIPHNQPHPRDSAYHFTNSLYEVTWRVATQADFEESGLPEKALEMFSKRQVILVSFRAGDPWSLASSAALKSRKRQNESSITRHTNLIES